MVFTLYKKCKNPCIVLSKCYSRPMSEPSNDNIAVDKALIRLEGVCKQYKMDDLPFFALRDVDLELPFTGMVAILGPSGCGKTTLLNLIAGLDHQTSGNLFINGVSSAQFKQKDWDVYRNSKIGFVFQNYNLINPIID